MATVENEILKLEPPENLAKATFKMRQDVADSEASPDFRANLQARLCLECAKSDFDDKAAPTPGWIMEPRLEFLDATVRLFSTKRHVRKEPWICTGDINTVETFLGYPG